MIDDGTYCGRELILLEQAQRAIMETNSLDVVKDIRDRAEAIRQFARSAALGLEIQNKAAETRLRAERQAGYLLHKMHLHGGDRRSSTHGEHLNLGKMGITRNQSQRWQKLAAIAEELFERYLRECKDLESEITSSGLRRFSRQRTPPSPDSHFNPDCAVLNKVIGDLATLLRRGEAFACITVYPPWPRPRRFGKDNSLCQHDKEFYRQLKKLQISELASEDCHLHLWATSDNLRNAFRLSDFWGFRYRHMLICERPVREYGAYWRTAQDFLVLGTRGHRQFKDNSLDSLIQADRGSPGGAQAIRRLIESASLGPYLEVFSDAAGPSRTVVSE